MSPNPEIVIYINCSSRQTELLIIKWGDEVVSNLCNKFSVGAYNIYNRNNPLYIDVVRDAFGGGSYKLESVNVLPLVPFVSLGLAF